MKKIFCVEDDADIRELLEYTLRASGFEATGFENAADFLSRISDELPDLVLLDIMLPDSDGIELLNKIRSTPDICDIPVIMLTAKTGRLDKIKGLESGADDYITKPFDVLELISRINAVFRRTPKKADRETNSSLSCKDIYLNTASRTVKVHSTNVPLTYKEYEILRLLIENKNTVVAREKLINEVWGNSFDGESRTVDVHIRTLRQKLGAAGECILTVRNVGYKIE